MRGFSAMAASNAPLDLAPGHVGGVHDAPRAVPAFARQVELDVGLLRSRGTARRFAQRRDALGPLAHTQIDDHVVAEPGARRHRVGHVRLEGVPFVEHAGDAPLRVLGVRLVALALGDDEHVAVCRRLEREGEPSDAAADDEVVTRDDGHRAIPRDPLARPG